MISVLLRYSFHGQFTLSYYLSFAPAIIIFLSVFAFAGLYPGIAVNPIEEFQRILRSASVGFLIMIGITFFLREGLVASRIIYFLAWLLTLVLVPMSRYLVRNWCSLQSWWGIPTVILGEERAVEKTLAMLKRNRRLGLRPIGILYDGEVVPSAEHIPTHQVFTGNLSHSNMFANDYRGCYAVLAMPMVGSKRLAEILSEHTDKYQRVLIIPDLFGVTSLSVKAKDICGMLMLEVNQQLTKFFPQRTKRLFDLIVCTLFLLPLLPLLGGLYLAVRLSSKGPAFYGQRRIGLGGREFKVWKFRSMVTNADEVLEQHLQADPELRKEWELDHKLRRDPRITGIGRLLRKTSLDELPQLWNVLRGDMSLVGPRPIVQREIEKYGDYYVQYCRVTPGITGLWQVSGRNNTTYEQRTRIDDYYVRNWSVSFDLYILYRTFKTVFLTEGAY